jgi:hypothetical protein
MEAFGITHGKVFDLNIAGQGTDGDVFHIHFGSGKHTAHSTGAGGGNAVDLPQCQQGNCDQDDHDPQQDFGNQLTGRTLGSFSLVTHFLFSLIFVFTIYGYISII